MKGEKYLLMSLFLLFFLSEVSFGQVNIIPKLRVDIAGSHEANDTEQIIKKNVNSGITHGVEISKNINPQLILGVGIQYQMKRTLDMKDGGEFGFVTLYASTLFRIASEEDSMTGILLNVGYNFIFNGDRKYENEVIWGDEIRGKLEGDLYLGIGGRVSLCKSFFLEGLYNHYTGSKKIEEKKVEITYANVSFGVGYVF